MDSNLTMGDLQNIENLGKKVGKNYFSEQRGKEEQDSRQDK
jgi:hypothetical protein